MTKAAALKILGIADSTRKRWMADRTIPPGVFVKGPKGRWVVCDTAFHRWWGGITSPPQRTRRAVLEEQLFPRSLR